MGLVRLSLALALLVALGAGAFGVAEWERAAPGPTGETVVDVTIVGPANATLFSGTLLVADATALTALRAACEPAGLAIETQEYPGMGTYVRAIGGYRAHGAAGWLYEVRSGAGSDWATGDRSAADYP